MDVDPAHVDLESSPDLVARLTDEARRASAHDRAVLAQIWRDRCRAEASVGNVFDQLVAELTSVGAPASIVELAQRAAVDEDRHARVCAELAGAYAVQPLDLHPVRAVRLASAEHADARVRTALLAVHVCCISETIACAFVEACLGACEGPALAEVHRRHLGDEIRHARVGWAYLATLPAEVLAELAPRLPAILEKQLGSWLGRIAELPEHGVTGHAYPPRDVLVDAVFGALDDMVLPGFDHVGVSTAAARAWRQGVGAGADSLRGNSNTR